MKIDILGLQAFIALAEHRGFQRAARALNLTQTALTKRLQSFESDLGVQLIERTTRSFALTTSGASFLPEARRLVEALEASIAAMRNAGATGSGSVTMACIPTAGLQFVPRVVSAYHLRFPDNRVAILDHASANVEHAVLRREAEFGIHVPTAGHPELTSEPLLDDPFVLACRDDHGLATARRLKWAQLQERPVIWAAPVGPKRSMLDAALGPHSLSLNVFCEVQHSATALGLVMEGVAAAVVPRLAIPRHRPARLRVITLSEPAVSRAIALVRRKGGSLSPATQPLFDLFLKARAAA